MIIKKFKNIKYWIFVWPKWYILLAYIKQNMKKVYLQKILEYSMLYIISMLYVMLEINLMINRRNIFTNNETVKSLLAYSTHKITHFKIIEHAFLLQIKKNPACSCLLIVQWERERKVFVYPHNVKTTLYINAIYKFKLCLLLLTIFKNLKQFPKNILQHMQHKHWKSMDQTAQLSNFVQLWFNSDPYITILFKEWIYFLTMIYDIT